MSAYDKTSIQINRCKRILALVDDYVEKQDAATRTDLRKALMEEFEAPAIAPPVAAGSVDTPEFEKLLVRWSTAGGGRFGLHEQGIPELRTEIIEYIDAWGAQQREAVTADLHKLAIEAQDRAEKAEAELAGQAQKFTLLESAVKYEKAIAEKAEARLAELEREKVAPSCDCHQCKPLSFENNSMILCATCGNKRCPHANDHRNACTGSNEPGQAGSAYE